MKNPIYTVAALALIVGSGLVHGAWANRWRTAPALADLAARLESVPTVLEEWPAPWDTSCGVSDRRRQPGRDQTILPAALLGVAWVQRLVRARESTLGFRCRADALEALHRAGNRRSRG